MENEKSHTHGQKTRDFLDYQHRHLQEASEIAKSAVIFRDDRISNDCSLVHIPGWRETRPGYIKFQNTVDSEKAKSFIRKIRSPTNLFGRDTPRVHILYHANTNYSARG